MKNALLDIATGLARTSKIWKNNKMSWTDFLKKLQTPVRTKETLAEYGAMKKAQQAELKDVGGFVGGHLKDGRRLPSNVLHRQLITLDADFADADFLSTLDIMYGGVAYVVYSTRSHTSKKPRYRLVIPLSEKVKADAYQAISRRIAADIGLSYFDNTTYQVERLMYWPSCSSDGEYVFESSDGVWLEPKKVLATYTDWRDSTTWPVAGGVITQLEREIKKQQNPLEKSGVVGAFCKTYSIHQAIAEFLLDSYAACADGSRYTYTQGSAAGGLVVYDDIFAYSHHGTDPTSNKLVNAFDLVRIHKFGTMDVDAEDGTLSNRLPSYLAMSEFAANLDGVKQTLMDERLNKAQEDFDDGEDWAIKLKINSKTGKAESSPSNIRLILKMDPNLKSTLAKDLLANRIVLQQELPWREKSLGAFWNDTDDSCLRNYLSEIYNITGKGVIDDSFRQEVDLNVYHPIRDYLRDLKWDGVPRMDKIFIDYLGADNSEYVRTATRKHLLAAVWRVMSPGVKYDYVLVLVGGQGIGKSLMCSRLGKQWFSDSLLGMQGKEALEQLRGSWIIEIGEMWATRKAENEAIKNFISKQSDRYREAYGRRVEEFPRQCIFFGTTNDEIFLRDRTGNRRFWPILCGQHDSYKKPYENFTPDVVDQIWAEAYQAYLAGEGLTVPEHVHTEARRQQEAHTEISEKTGIILEYLDTKLPEGWEAMDLYERRGWLNGEDELKPEGTITREKVCALEIWCEVFSGDIKSLNNITSREINDILRGLPDWEQYKDGAYLRRGKLYGRQRVFVRRTKNCHQF